MEQLKQYKKNKGVLYRILKGGSFVGLAGTLGIAFNHQHLVTVWGDKVASIVILVSGFISAVTPSFTSMLADILYPEDESDDSLENG
jgi:hypothetical protein